MDQLFLQRSGITSKRLLGTSVFVSNSIKDVANSPKDATAIQNLSTAANNLQISTLVILRNAIKSAENTVKNVVDLVFYRLYLLSAVVTVWAALFAVFTVHLNGTVTFSFSQFDGFWQFIRLYHMEILLGLASGFLL
jgi:hypothetical protein